MLKELVVLSNRLDSKGFVNEASYLDVIINKIAEDKLSEETEDALEDLEVSRSDEDESAGMDEDLTIAESYMTDEDDEDEESVSKTAPPSAGTELATQSLGEDSADMERPDGILDEDDFAFLITAIKENTNAGGWFVDEMMDRIKKEGSPVDASLFVGFLESALRLAQSKLGETNEGPDEGSEEETGEDNPGEIS